ncbi:permease [Erythrobacter sp. HL-111]|uniref:CBU_0592 family membrane protein n=1 Tax=Erythrobacter sp. HL-111 TaxID=1798193 RepID=UPI0006DB9A76|nr:permease [Erythrobacter sp. HL-111]KPP95054.1 MAG: hypothetical protein HLUCCO15_03125 [Erythrobacteraceae bacterium HL-111]SDS09583.1 hypothetical protein SAMN04515621_0947 [Erythrobacter sp. HL-111]
MSAPLDTYSLVGFAGTACIIGAYAYLTLNARPNPFVLHGANLAGAALLTVSLLVHTNWPSLALEGFWAAIAITGLVKALRSGSAASSARARQGRRTKDAEAPDR